MKTRRLGLVILSIFLFIGCRNQAENQIHSVWSFIREKPDSALAILEDYHVSDFRARRGRAEYALLKSIALDKNYIDLTTDSLIRPALDYYEGKRNADKKMLCWYYLGCVQANAGDYNDAIVSISRAEDYSAHTEDLYQVGLIHMAKENIFSLTHNHTEALQEATKGVELFERINEKNQVLKAKRKMALDYLSLEDNHSADSLFLLLSSEALPDSAFSAKCILECARSKALQGDYAKALLLFEQGQERKQVSMSIPQAGMYALAQFYAGQPSIGKEIKNQLAGVPSARSTYLWVCYHESLVENNAAGALHYHQELMSLEDSIAVATMEQSIIKSQREYQHQSREVFRLKAERRRLLLFVLFITGLLISMGMVWGYRLLRKRHQTEKEELTNAINEARRLTQEADEKNSVLYSELHSARKQYVAAYKKRFAKIAHLSETYYRTSGFKDAREQVYREVRDLSSFITQDTRTFRQLEKSVNSGLSNAMKIYRLEYPGLEERDYRFVCYLMAGFPASTISLLTGLSSGNVYVRKNRLLDHIRNSGTEHKDLFILAIE